ncbi:hypothetical protein LPICM17_110003 [Lactococcus piscium]|nr:hypothetical protein LP2241_10360 [Lactococcus piscium]SOB46812.1 hypothetical protein LPICM17_110003 [Lactococcus piscium]
MTLLGRKRQVIMIQENHTGLIVICTPEWFFVLPDNQVLYFKFRIVTNLKQYI